MLSTQELSTYKEGNKQSDAKNFLILMHIWCMGSRRYRADLHIDTIGL